MGSLSTPNTSDPRTTTTTFDANYHTYPTHVTNPLGHLTQTAYDYALGLPTIITDTNQISMTLSYDVFGRLTEVRKFGDYTGTPTLAFSYHHQTAPFGDKPFWTEAVQKIDDSRTFSVRKYYSGIGQLLQTQMTGDITTVSDNFYDAAGRLYRQSVPYEVTTGSAYHVRDTSQPYTQTAFDALSRPYLVTAPDETETEYTYAIVDGQVKTSVTDGRGNTTHSYADAWGQTVKVDPPDGPDVVYVYDRAGRLTQVTYGSAVTTLTYDYAGRKTTMDDPDMGDWAYTYDALGNLTFQDDAKGQRTCLYYDPLNRLKGKVYTTTASACPTPDPGYNGYAVKYYYDQGGANENAIGQRTSMQDASGSTAWEYDPRGRLVEEHKTIGTQTYTTAWTYNTANLVESMTYPSGEEVTFAYNGRMLLESLQSSISNEFYAQGMLYDAAGRLTDRDLYNGSLHQDYTYYPWTSQGGRLDMLVTTNLIPTPDVVLQDLDYTYDAVGNITELDDDGTTPNETHAYDYDALNRLTDWSLNLAPQESYTYDSDTGNLVSKAGVTLVYTTTAGLPVHAAYGYGDWSYDYDANGNMTTRAQEGQATQTLTYDAENRLVLVQDAPAPSEPVAEYVYDGDGNLVKETIYQEGVDKVTVYIGSHFEACLSGCAFSGATPTPTATATATQTLTATATQTLAASHTPTTTATRTPTATQTATATRTPTVTRTATRTATPTRTATATQTLAASHTPTATATRTPTATPTATGAAPSDDFNRADSSSLGANWTERAGNLRITSNTLRNDGTSVNFRPIISHMISAKVYHHFSPKCYQ